MLIAAPTLAQCLPEEGRFSKETIEYQGTSLWVVNDNRTQLQWMMCPLGQQGEQCLALQHRGKEKNLIRSSPCLTETNSLRLLGDYLIPKNFSLSLIKVAVTGHTLSF